MDQQTKDPDVLNVLVLERVDRTKSMARYYVLSVEPTLFAESSLVRRWGRIGAPGEHESTFMLPRRSRR
jgi:predicted DNA-binding WGR domain protein